jgi:hypothetical protein
MTLLNTKQVKQVIIRHKTHIKKLRIKYLKTK